MNGPANMMTAEVSREMMRTTAFVRLAAILLLGAAPLCAQVADHPSKLAFAKIDFEPPRPADHRVELPSGMVVYLMEDRLLPTLDASARFRTGSLYDPAGKEGLAAMTGEVMRTGGVADLSADELDERLAYLGATLSCSISAAAGRASLTALSKDTDECLELLAGVLMRPAFEEDRIALYKDQALQRLRTKNDSPRRVLDREFEKLLYGDHPLVREETRASIEGIARDDLIAFHTWFAAPNNTILCIAGDFEKEAMLEKIEAAFADWPRKEVRLPEIPAVSAKNRPGVFLIQKDTNQGFINVGHFGIEDTNPDVFAIDVMSFILGGGSFTSRITTRVRSDEGLAYNTGCRFAKRHAYPGTFYGYVQTKSATVPYAISLILDEFRRIRAQAVSEEELATAKSFYLDSFPNRFATAIGTLEAFAELEYDGFPSDYFATYRQKIEAVTCAEVLRVANEYIRPEEMTVFVVGDLEACRAGDGKHPASLSDFGEATVIALDDPLAGE